MRRTARFFTASLVLATALAAAPAEYRIIAPDGVKDHNPSPNLTEKDIGWLNLSEFYENQHGALFARFDQGYWLEIIFFTFKYGPQQRWGV